MTVAVVLYEDKRGVTNEFGLHDLVISCIADQLNEDFWDIKDRIEGIPKNGNSKVLRACREDKWLAAGGRKVIAVYDSDRIHLMLGLSANACRTQVLEKARHDCPFDDQLVVVLLEKNMESVIEALRVCEGVDRDSARQEAKESHGNLELRDRLLNKLARNAARRGDRKCVLEEMPSLARLVDALVPLFSS